MIVSGSVKFFNEERGYGFMLPDQPLGDTFFHIAALRKMGIPHVLLRGAVCVSNVSFSFIPVHQNNARLKAN